MKKTNMLEAAPSWG